MNNNIKYRLKFTKTGNMIFIGHLDFLKFFQRTVKRAGLPIAYSLGFNPHQLVTFAIPLSLGVSSVSEYVDIQLKENMDTLEIKERLNSTMPLGVKILDVRKLEEGEKACAAEVAVGSYKVTLPEKYDNIEQAVDFILKSDEINVERVVKKKAKITNIRPLIYELGASDNVVNAVIATGSQGNLKIELLLEQLYKAMDREFIPYKIDIERNGLYKEESGEIKML